MKFLNFNVEISPYGQVFLTSIFAIIFAVAFVIYFSAEDILYASLIAFPFILASGIFIFLITRKSRLEIIKYENLLKAARGQEDFARTAAHNLRTPLSVILLTTDSVEVEILNLPDSDRKRTLRDLIVTVKKYSLTMLDVINNILETVESRTDLLQSKNVVDMKKSIEEMIKANRMGEKIRIKNIRFDVSAADIPLLLLNRYAVDKILFHFLSNAIDYTPPGGRVNLKCFYKDAVLECSVHDNGIGIPEAEQKDVFRRFFRASNAVEQKNIGSGLGLHLVKRIIESLGGEIWFYSRQNIGTTFFFRLPAEIPKI